MCRCKGLQPSWIAAPHVRLGRACSNKSTAGAAKMAWHAAPPSETGSRSSSSWLHVPRARRIHSLTSPHACVRAWRPCFLLLRPGRDCVAAGAGGPRFCTASLAQLFRRRACTDAWEKLALGEGVCLRWVVGGWESAGHYSSIVASLPFGRRHIFFSFSKLMR